MKGLGGPSSCRCARRAADEGRGRVRGWVPPGVMVEVPAREFAALVLLGRERGRFDGFAAEARRGGGRAERRRRFGARMDLGRDSVVRGEV